MSLWEYKEHIDPTEASLSPFEKNCIYCNSRLDVEEIDSHWSITTDHFLETFQETRESMIEFHGLTESELELSVDSFDDELTEFGSCRVCGWWTIRKLTNMWAGTQLWDSYFGVSGTIKNLDLTKQDNSLGEIRGYLTAKYNERFNLNPKAFEDVVCSVYKSLGYNTYTTSYSNDGGIDVVMQGADNELTGIQVKRYKNSIKVEQIRAFLGAMIINNMTKGIFVSTSDFQSGCHTISKSYPIDLVNAQKFYEALKKAQVKEINPIKTFDETSVPNLFHFATMHRNSL